MSLKILKLALISSLILGNTACSFAEETSTLRNPMNFGNGVKRLKLTLLADRITSLVKIYDPEVIKILTNILRNKDKEHSLNPECYNAIEPQDLSLENLKNIADNLGISYSFHKNSKDSVHQLAHLVKPGETEETLMKIAENPANGWSAPSRDSKYSLLTRTLFSAAKNHDASIELKTAMQISSILINILKTKDTSAKDQYDTPVITLDNLELITHDDLKKENLEKITEKLNGSFLFKPEDRVDYSNAINKLVEINDKYTPTKEIIPDKLVETTPVTIDTPVKGPAKADILKYFEEIRIGINALSTADVAYPWGTTKEDLEGLIKNVWMKDQKEIKFATGRPYNITTTIIFLTQWKHPIEDIVDMGLLIKAANNLKTAIDDANGKPEEKNPLNLSDDEMNLLIKVYSFIEDEVPQLANFMSPMNGLKYSTNNLIKDITHALTNL